MNATATVAVSLAAALAVTVGSSLFESDRVEAAPETELGRVVSDLALRVEGLVEEQRALSASIAELQIRPTAAGGERRTVGELEAAIDRYLASRQPEELRADEAAETRDDLASLDVRSILEALADPNRDWLEKEELWQRLREEGRLDEVIAEYERLAEIDPNNPDRKVELGYAYIQKIQEVGASALAGKWAGMADAQFDAALELDETHWEARFMKAMALSHWPAFTGKTAETIAQFEKLIEIQSAGPVESKHVQTYLTLGNIYMGQGKYDLALATWQKGLGFFPGDASLLAQIEAIQQQ